MLTMTAPSFPGECRECNGTGVIITDSHPLFDMRAEQWYPNDVEEPCNACEGTGEA